jgi:uncharacterized membrane protein
MERSGLKGYLFGILAALCWATSPVFIRKGFVGLPSSYWGVTIGLGTAALIYLVWIAVTRLRKDHSGFHYPLALSPALKAAIFFQVLAGIASSLGTIGRTRAIELAPIVIVIPLASTQALWTLIFAPLFLGRKLERITLKLVLGAALVVVGSTIVVISSN